MREITEVQEEAIRLVLAATDEQVAEAMRIWRNGKDREERKNESTN